MVGKNNDSMAIKALKAIAEEDLESFIDSKNISDEALRQALLTAVDIDILCDDYELHKPTISKAKKELIKEDA